MNTLIPIHDYYEEDVYNTPIRYIPLLSREDYGNAQPHRHNYFEIFFFTIGGGQHEIDFKNYPIKDLSIHFIEPGQVHVLRRDPLSNGCVLHFTEDIYHGFSTLKKLIYTSGTTLTVTDQQYQELWQITSQLQYEYNRSPINSSILKSYLDILVLRCVEFNSDINAKPRNTLPAEFVKFKQMVDNEYLHNKNPGWYAGQLGINLRKLNNICKVASGVTCSEYIISRVLLEAKRLLYHSNLTVKEISYYLGFEDPAYFNRFFKKKHGTTAGEFRKNSFSL